MMKNLIVIVGFLLVSTNMVTAQAECDSTPPQGLTPLQAYSIFQSNYKGKDYSFALDYGRWMICAKPLTIESYKGFNLATQYDKFVKIYQALAEEQDDPTIKAAYLDTALTLFDDKMELFGDDKAEAFEIHQQKGRFYLQNYTHIDNGLSKAYAEFRAMFDLNPKRATESASGYYVRVVLDDMVSKGEKENAQSIIDKAMPFASPDIQEYLKNKQQDILGSPEEQIAFFNCSAEGEGGLADDPTNLEILETCLGAYKQLDDLSNLARIGKALHELQPTFQSASDLGDIEKGNARYTAALDYYKQALSLAETEEDKLSLYLDLSDVSISLGKLKDAKGYAQQAIKANPNFGRAYIEMARIYGAVISKCTEDRKLEATDKVVYWVVIDYLNLAKRKDPSVANTVNSQLSTYEAVTPSAEDKFLKLNYKDGEKIKVDGSLMPCYSIVNETTTVR